MRCQTFRFFKRRNPVRRPAARIRLAVEELESRTLLAVNVLTYEYDTANGGVNANETQLTPANVASGSFGKLFNTPLDGQVYAQPLVDTGVTIGTGPYTTPGAAGVHDVVFVATENDSLYAIDADPSSSGEILWQRSFLNANDANDALAGATSVTAVPWQDATAEPDIAPTYGITSTPVIDPSTNILYAITDTKETVGGVAHFVQRLHAINLADGTDATTPFMIGDTTGDNDNTTSIYVYGNGPGSVTDPYNGTGQPVAQFNALHENQRSALRLVNGTLYAAWASHGDTVPFYGWVVAWNVSNLASNGLQLSGVFNANPDGGEDGIWESGAGPTFTPDGSAFYFVTGNAPEGSVTLGSNGLPTNGNYTEAVVEATLDPSTTPQNQNVNGWGFQVVDYFIPAEAATLGDEDLDLASDAALLPSSAGIAGHSNLLVAGDKAGQLFLLDADDLGGYDPTNQDVLNAVPNSQGNLDAPSYFKGVLSSPVYFNGELYVVGGYDDPARAFTINSDGTLSQDSQTSDTLGYEPGSPVISANGTSNGIVWIMDRTTNELQAYAADNLGDELWNSGTGANALGSSIKFAVPSVANGMVFVGTATGLVAYGLTPANAVSQAPSLSATVLSGTSVNLNWQDASQRPNIASAYLIEESSDGVHFTQVTTAPQGATSLTLGGLTPGITYSFRIRGLNAIGDSPYSNVVTVTPPFVLQAPALPSGLHGTAASSHSIALSWTNNSSNQTGFYLDRATNAGFTQNLITEALSAAPSSFTDTANGLTPGGTYYYRLRAFNAAGSSANTAAVAVTIPPPPSNNGGGSTSSLPSPAANSSAAMSNTRTALLPSLVQLELDVILLMTYLNFASSDSGEDASALFLNAQIRQWWSAITANPLVKTPLGLYALLQGFAQAQSSG
ncbi:MAG: fibronectin type III domain-containing protein [Gemmataceae bacterium]